MRMKPNESAEDWAKRVQQYEQGRALQRLAKGEDINLVLEEMSKLITQKLMHPIIQTIKDSRTSTYDAEAGRQAYEENYLNKHAPKADQVADLPNDYTGL